MDKSGNICRTNGGNHTEEQLIRRTQEEKFKGKLNENDTKCLLFLNNWDPDAALKDISEGSIKDLKEKIEGTAEDVQLKKEAVIKALHEKTATGYVQREYACRECDRVWWAWSPARKQVSTCKECQVRYDPVPEDKEFGWAIYECFCGNNFNGYGQMHTTYGKCYKRRGGCGRKILPVKILPTDRKRVPKSTPGTEISSETKETSEHKYPNVVELYNRTANTYPSQQQGTVIKDNTSYSKKAASQHDDSYTAESTTNKKSDGVPRMQEEKDRRPKSRRAKYNEHEDLYRDMGRPIGTRSHNYTGQKFRGINVGHDLEKMPWPRGKQRKSSKKCSVETRELAAGKKKVLYPSKPHVSTGSTVADFLTQDDDMSMTSSYIAKLQTIDEEPGSTSSSSDSGHDPFKP